MRAIIHEGKQGIEGLQYTEQRDRQPGEGEVKIRLKTAGLNHRDLFLMSARTSQDSPLILGSDGAGRIEAVGDEVAGLSPGAEVIINPCIGWERTEQVPVVPAILGGPTDGTFAESVIVPWQNVAPKPAYLTWEEAGVLSLSALTAYRALFTRGDVQPGDHVLIPGIGGGVATFAAQMAAAIGAEVTVTSRSEMKRQAAMQLPIAQALDSHTSWGEQLAGKSVDVILDSVGPALFDQYFEVIKPNGKIIMFGASSGDEMTIPARAIFFPQLHIIGTSMGSREEFVAMLQFMEQHALHPVIDTVYPLRDTALAFSRMERGEQLGNIAIAID
ncbi:zinc-binding dehydrogenase [Paenibacillus sp. SYP-B4298]|uniref:zinc-binding dehydrogenase n=1 Tax=Paenibacillus sp. SYP-B4298 TaxID=2996034 RepID=UPI0022DDEE27|nr:zinc-binding dehydrogenase [Paenibacillus sp. SYP-B4298]